MNSIRILVTGLFLIPLIPVYFLALIGDIIICLTVLGLDLTSRYSPDDVCLVPQLNKLIRRIAGYRE